MSTDPGTAMQGKPGTVVLQKVWPTTTQGDEVLRIPFDYNPEKITIGHSHTGSKAAGSSQAEQITALGFVEIALSKIVFAGPDTKKYCDSLIIWSYPVEKDTGKPVAGTDGSDSSTATTVPVNLTLSWSLSSQLDWPLHLRKVDISYTRFSSDGNPIRAEVNIGLYQDRTQFLEGTNPTSGGPVGRRALVLDSSDRLPSLAAANYGRASAWRQIARANGVDDPLRVKPGTTVFLPEPSEMTAGPAQPGAGR